MERKTTRAKSQPALRDDIRASLREEQQVDALLGKDDKEQLRASCHSKGKPKRAKRG